MLLETHEAHLVTTIGVALARHMQGTPAKAKSRCLRCAHASPSSSCNKTNKTRCSHLMGREQQTRWGEVLEATKIKVRMSCTSGAVKVNCADRSRRKNESLRLYLVSIASAWIDIQGSKVATTTSTENRTRSSRSSLAFSKGQALPQVLATLIHKHRHSREVQTVL